MEGEIRPEILKHFRPFPPGAKYVEGCWDPDGYFINYTFSPGDVWRNPTKCNRKTCLRDGTIIEEVCPEPVVPAGCLRIKGNCDDDYQDFPWCCDRVACPGDDEYWEDDPMWPEQCDDKYCVRDIGEEWTEHKYGICNRKRCGRNKYNKAKIFEEKCPEVEVPKGCKLEAYPDLTKDFPDCCPKVVCPRGHPARKSEDSENDQNKTVIPTAGPEIKIKKGADSHQNEANSTAGNENGTENKVEYKKSEFETGNKTEKEDVKNLLNTTEDKMWKSYNINNTYEFFK